jgi:tRNA (mo5U34)-methyltransferase
MSANLESYFDSPRTPVEKEIADLGPWFHNLHLPDGTQTAPYHPLGDFPHFKWEEIEREFPKNLSGLKILDIGCNAGFYSFKLAQRGAQVLGIDVDAHYLKQAHWASRHFDVTKNVSFKKMQVYELWKLQASFDIVIFMGVFYHLRYPLLALDIVSRTFSQFMVFQTMTMPGEDVSPTIQDMRIVERDLMLEPGWPKMAFIENKLEGDPTNWWAPNHSAVEAMLRSTGLEIYANPAHEIYFCKHAKVGNIDEGHLKAALDAICR